MVKAKLLLGAIASLAIGLAACSGEQSDWEKARASNNAETYEAFVHKYPNGSFAAQAQARLKELYEERDWQKARDADTSDSYQAFLKQYPEGKWAEEARIRVENFNLAQAPGGAPLPASAASGAAEVTPAAGAPSAAPPPTPAQPAVATKPAAATRPAAAAKSAAAGGTWGVQLGAFSSGQKAADRHWAALTKKYPSLLSGLTPKVRRSASGKTHLYRLQVTGLKATQASAICKALQAKHDSCALLKPAHAKKKLKGHAKKH
jgi:cell division protein FtsN